MFAARYGHAGVVEYLLGEAKIDASAVSKDGKTAAELAEFWGSTEAVAVFDRLAPNKKKVHHSAGSPFATAPSPMDAGAGVTTHSGIADWWKRRTVHKATPLHFTGAIHNRYRIRSSQTNKCPGPAHAVARLVSSADYLQPDRIFFSS